MMPKPLRYLMPVLALIGAGSVAAAEVSPSMLKIERFNAERGDVQSQYFLGEHYELGDSGVEQDLSLALEWYGKAAEKGHAAAQYKIGMFHDKGYAGLRGGRAVAMEWYRKAAGNGSDDARKQLDEIRQAEDEEEAAVKHKQQAAEQERRRQLLLKRRREQERARMLRANKPKMAALPVKMPKKYPPEQTINWLLSSQWADATGQAEFLPAKDMSCLKSGESEITCFSRERHRVIKNSRLSFSVKSVLSDFAEDGQFVATYYYNVTNIEKARNQGPAADVLGLRVKSGWQQPGLTAKCRIKDEASVQCKANNQLSQVFSGE